MASTGVTLAKTAYFGYKAFQAFRLLMGDVTVVVEVIEELLVDGLGEFALESSVEQSAEHMKDMYDNASDLRKSTRNFGVFCDQLADDLGTNNPQAKALIGQAHQLYEVFCSIDTDGSGTLSRQEIRTCFGRIGYSTQVADEEFDYLDTDKDGEVTFEELMKWLGPDPGRHEDKSRFECKGQHALKAHKWDCVKLCTWCGETIPPNTKILVCITCVVNACHNCIVEHKKPTGTLINCKPRHGLFKIACTGVDTCSACKGHIPEGVISYSCRQSCPVYVCATCTLNVPEDLYFTGLRHG